MGRPEVYTMGLKFPRHIYGREVELPDKTSSGGSATTRKVLEPYETRRRKGGWFKLAQIVNEITAPATSGMATNGRGAGW